MAGWWIPRLYTTPVVTGGSAVLDNSTNNVQFWTEIVNGTAAGLANALVQEVKDKVVGAGNSTWTQYNGSGIGSGWIKSLLGRSEWILPCTQWKIAV